MGSAAASYDRLPMTFKAVAIAAAVTGALAVGLHLYAPELMRHFGQMLHGGH